MKLVIRNDELIKVEEEAIELLCNTVKETLGPTGNNIIINRGDQSPFITNDGVTIAENIESEDKRINSVLELIKEASLKTNEEVGDGTTTTLVLLQAIFKEGLKYIEKGKNKIKLKQELLSTIDKVTKELDRLKRNPKKEDYYKIALTATNDLEISKIATDAFLKTKRKQGIHLEEGEEETIIKTKSGYTIPITKLKSIYFERKKEILLENVMVFILKGYLNDLEQISEIINVSISEEKNILIICEGMSEEVKNELFLLYQNYKNIIGVELEEVGTHREKIEQDIKKLSKGSIKNIDLENISLMDHGTLPKILIQEEELTIIQDEEERKELIKELEEEIKKEKSDYEKDFIYERISKLEQGITTIYVGGITKSEKKEKIMRYQDAIGSLDSAKSGITLGEGIPYLKIGNDLKEENDGDKIIKETLKKPFEEILNNLGAEKEQIEEEIKKNRYQKVYDYKEKTYKSLEETDIIDSILILKTAFKNAVSIASLLLSTSSLVINLEDKEKGEIL